ncbi:hypothetical protein R3M60_20620, partial [Bacillus subtilis]
QIVNEGIDVDDLASRQVQKEGSRPHHSEFAIAKKVDVTRASIDVKGHRLDAPKQLFHGVTLMSVTHRQNIGNVVEKHL